MDLFLQYLLSSVIEILAIGIVPFICWLVAARKKSSFARWIGLKRIKTDRPKTLILWILGVTVVFALCGAFLLRSLRGVATATSSFAGRGWQALPAILVYAIFNTALPEELLFRGFFLKRAFGGPGFKTANTIQALLFGVLHAAMFYSSAGIAKALVIFLFTTAIAALMGHINEKLAGGSIYPSWIIHAVSNILSGIYTAFELI